MTEAAMPCGLCPDKVVTDPFHDTVDDQGVLQLGAWRWASWCRTCGSLVDDRVPGRTAPLIERDLDGHADARCDNA